MFGIRNLDPGNFSTVRVAAGIRQREAETGTWFRAATADGSQTFNPGARILPRMKPVYVQGLSHGGDTAALSAAIGEVFLKTTDNLSRLSEGDTVLLKPALNSPDRYPSTTHPLAVSVTASLLAEKGADIVIGDQSGIGH